MKMSNANIKLNDKSSFNGGSSISSDVKATNCKRITYKRSMNSFNRDEKYNNLNDSTLSHKNNNCNDIPEELEKSLEFEEIDEAVKHCNGVGKVNSNNDELSLNGSITMKAKTATSSLIRIKRVTFQKNANKRISSNILNRDDTLYKTQLLIKRKKKIKNTKLSCMVVLIITIPQILADIGDFIAFILLTLECNINDSLIAQMFQNLTHNSYYNPIFTVNHTSILYNFNTTILNNTTYSAFCSQEHNNYEKPIAIIKAITELLLIVSLYNNFLACLISNSRFRKKICSFI